MPVRSLIIVLLACVLAAPAAWATWDVTAQLLGGAGAVLTPTMAVAAVWTRSTWWYTNALDRLIS